MTATGLSDSPPPPTDTHSPRLERTSRYRGVCSALARTTGTDVVLWHVMFIVLAFFNGIGLVLYVVALVLIPERGQPNSLGQRLLHGPDRHLEAPDILVLALLALVTAGLGHHSDGFSILVVVAFGLLIFNKGSFVIRTGSSAQDRGLHSSADPDVPMGAATSAEAPAIAPLLPVARVSELARPPRPRSALAALTMGITLLVVGFMVLLNTAASADISPEVIIASALAIVGAGIVVSAWWGRSLLLVPLAVLLGLALAATSVARPAIEAGVGERTWHPTGSANYRLGVGDATLDLRDVVITESTVTAVTARVDVGHLIVIVPPDVRVAIHAEAEVGDLLILGRDTNGRRASRDDSLGPEGRPQLRLDASVRLGEVEVRNG